MTQKLIASLAALFILVILGCSTAPERAESKAVLKAKVEESLAEFKDKYPSIKNYLNDSYGYAVLPKVLKGAFWVGGAGGKGAVYEKGELVGYYKNDSGNTGLFLWRRILSRGRLFLGQGSLR